MATSDLSKHFGPENPIGVTGSPDSSWQWGGGADTQKGTPRRKRRGLLDEEGYFDRATAIAGGRADTPFAQAPGPDDSETYLNRIKRLTESIPEPVDQFGQRIYGNTQFAGGLDPNARRFYDLPGEVGGGYFRSNDEVAEKLGYGKDAGEFLAQGRGIMSRGLTSKLEGIRSAIQDIGEGIARDTGNPLPVSGSRTLREQLDDLKNIAINMRNAALKVGG